MTDAIIVGGPPGCGKSTVAAALCAHAERSVHLEADKFPGFIRSGYVLPWLAEAQAQNEMAARAAARAAAVYLEAGYDVVVDGFIRPWSLSIYAEELTTVAGCIHYVVLLPDVEVVVQRGLTRPDTHGVPEPVLRDAYPEFASDAFEGHRVDSSMLSVDQTVEEIERGRESGRFVLNTSGRSK